MTFAMYISCRSRAPWLVMRRQASTASSSFSGRPSVASSAAGRFVAIVQRARDRFEATLVVAPGADVSAAVEGLRSTIAGLAGHPAGLEVAIGVVDDIPAGPGGKFRAVTCEVAA